MDERKDTEETKSDPQVAPVAKAAPDLPSVESPSISPASADTVPPAPVFAPVVEPAVEPAMATAPEIAVEPVAPVEAETAAPSRFTLRPRHRRYAVLAASVAMAAVIGAVVGAVASGGFAPPPPPAAPRVDVAAIEETKAMQQQVARLAKEVTTLKANLDAANKTSRTQIAKISERLTERVSRDSAEVTGSISAPETIAAAPQAAPAPVQPQAQVPTPPPRPQQLAALETRMPGRAPLVAGWSIHDFRNGHLYVEGNGEIYQVVPGARLPGIGAVESIKRQEGRWVVSTPKGIIVAARDRRYFDPF